MKKFELLQFLMTHLGVLDVVEDGDLESVKWVAEQLKENKELSISDPRIIQAIAKSGNLESMQWLMTLSVISRQDITTPKVIKNAVKSGNDELIKWLLSFDMQ